MIIGFVFFCVNVHDIHEQSLQERQGNNNNTTERQSNTTHNSPKHMDLLIIGCVFPCVGWVSWGSGVCDIVG